MKHTEKMLKYIEENINDDLLKIRIKNFVLSNYSYEMKLWKQQNIFKYFKTFLSNLELIKNLNWDNYCAEHETMELEVKMISRMYFKYVVENNLCNCKYQEYLKENLWIFDVPTGMALKDTFFKGSNPQYFYQVELNNNGNISYTRFNLNTDDVFIKDLLIRFIGTLSDVEKKTTRFKIFVYRFKDSLYSITNEVKGITDFNYDTFRKQYRFYKNIKWGNHKATSLLCRFYVFLFQEIENMGIKHELFTMNDRIDKYYLYRVNFSRYYDNGYHIVYMNKFDKIPKFDRWMTAPNGQEVTTLTRKSYEYFPISFSDISNKLYRDVFKNWFWYSDTSIYAKEKSSYCIREFLSFIEDIKRCKYNTNLIFLNKNLEVSQNNNITGKEILLYRSYIKSKYSNRNTVKGHFKSVKDFLGHCYDNELIDVNIRTLQYLDGVTKEYSKPNPLTREDVNKVVARYKELSIDGNEFEKLQTCIITLLLTTNFRVREILNLKRNCIIETMKVGQFAISRIEDINKKVPINIKRKFMNEYTEENIGIYTYRLIRKAITITQDLSDNADEAIRDYLFLTVTYNKIVKVIDKGMVDDYFKKILKDVGLNNKYSIYNLRDTYMTNIYDEGKKRGLSVAEIHLATGHKSMETTIQHYRESDIQNYLEAFYGIKIGNVDIKGNIIHSIDEIEGIDNNNIKAITVSEECGYCEIKGCGDSKKVDCLICTFFITTIDNLPYFKKRLSKVDDEIKMETIEHEKEHLIKIKQLLLGYVKEIYILKGENNI